MRSIVTAAVLLSLSSPLIAGKPPGGGGSPPVDPQVAYRLPDGKGTKLVVSNESGANQMVLYKSSTSFDFDLAPRAQQQIAIVDGTQSNASLKLLTYSVNSGVYVQTSVRTLAPARRGSSADFSSDGTKIAYACCWDGTNEKLAVYDLTDDSITYWATRPFFWDITWFRGDASIAYSSETQLYEVAGAGATPQFLFSGNPGGQIDVDSARTDSDALVISYNDTTGAARIGLWKNGSFINSDLANSARSWQGALNCRDDKLAYLGVQNNSGSQAFYIRDLTSGATTLVSKNSNILLQFWPTC